MKHLVIAIDCDDVLINATEYVVKTYNNTYGTAVKMEHAHKSQNPEWEAERDEVFSRLEQIQHTDEYALIAPRKDAINTVKRLAVDHELHLVSARPNEVLDVTQRMLDTHFPGIFRSVEHVGVHRSKGDVCRALGADVMIDDNIKHLLSAQEAGVKKLIWFGKYPWQNDDEWVEGIDRCLTWEQTKEEIDRFASK